MAKQSTRQRKTVGRVMHEWKHGELESSRGGKVKSRRQAVAIGLSEAGASNQRSPRQNRRQRARTAAKQKRRGPTRAQLYRQAARRKIPGRSRMSKAQLQRALAK